MSARNKSFIVFFILSSFISTTQAQSKYVIGSRAGLNYSLFYSDRWNPIDASDYGDYQLISKKYHVIPRFLWTGGVFIRRTLKEKWELQLEALYSANGHKLNQIYKINKNDLDITNTMNFKIMLHYLQFPLFARYNLNTKFFAVAGIQPSFLLRAAAKSMNTLEYHTHASGEFILKEIFSDVKTTEIKSYKRFDIPILVGIDYVIHPYLNIGFRTVLGTRKIYKENANYRNLNFQLALSFIFNKSDHEE